MKHRKQNLWNVYDEIASALIHMPKGRVVFAADVGKSDYRLAEQSYYKGTRRKNMTPKEVQEYEAFSEAYLQFLQISKLLKVQVFDIAGVEADDTASILAEYYVKRGYRVVFLTSDNDWKGTLLEHDNVWFYDVTTRETHKRLDVQSKYGVKTKREFCILKAISGDAGDNILLLKGVGVGRGATLFENLKEKYTEPTDEQVIHFLTRHMEENPKRVLRNEHVTDGRSDIASAYYSNMRMAETMTDLSLLTGTQRTAFKAAMQPPPDTGADLFEYTIELLGYPVMLSAEAAKVFQ